MAIGLPSKRGVQPETMPTKRYLGGGFKVSSLGSIENDFRGLRLKGDEMSPGHGKFYGVTKTGKKGFVTLDDIDPESEGSIFGADEHVDISVASEAIELNGKAFGYFAISSTMTKEEEDEDGKKFLSVYAFGRPIFFTAAGRAFKIGEEQVKCIASVPITAKAEDSSTSLFYFDESTRTIGGGAVAMGRSYIMVDKTLEIPDGYTGPVCLTICYDNNPLYNPRAVYLEKRSGFDEPTNSECYIPLYDFSNGVIVRDYRNAPVSVMRD